MAVTYEKIATNTLGAGVATVTFSSIPATYTDLVLICDTKASTGTPNNRMQVNSDTATNYSQTVLAGNGTTATSARSSSNTFIYADYYATNDTTNNKNTIIQFMNYANTSTYKTILSRANNAAAGTDAIVGLWRSTSAINSITVYVASSWASGAIFSLYGIKAA